MFLRRGLEPKGNRVVSVLPQPSGMWDFGVCARLSSRWIDRHCGVYEAYYAENRRTVTAFQSFLPIPAQPAAS